jgi:phospholipase/lecithinase/hemolysin
VTQPGILDFANADTHLFWDDVHPSTRAHRMIASAIFDAVQAAGLLRKTALPE